MKRILLVLLLSCQIINAHTKELKIYRRIARPRYLVGMLGGITGIVISSFFLELACSDKKLKPLLVPSALGLLASGFLLKSYIKWAGKRNEPILIFDEYGFTYEKNMGLFKERQPVRYLWKNVISHWSAILVDGMGNEIQKTWYYHIAGEEEILAIDVLELSIPKKLKAMVESLRQGYIRALY